MFYWTERFSSRLIRSRSRVHDNYSPPLRIIVRCLINGISAGSSRSESRESTEGIRLRLWSSKEPHHVDFNNTRHPARPDGLFAWRSAQIRSVSQNPLLFVPVDGFSLRNLSNGRLCHDCCSTGDGCKFVKSLPRVRRGKCTEKIKKIVNYQRKNR